MTMPGEHEYHRDPEQAELFGEDREDEVGGALRQEIEMRLRPVEPSLAVEPPEPMAILDWRTW